jgi:hypothetical protein
MSNQVNLVLANDVVSAGQVSSINGLTTDDTAIVTRPEFMEKIPLNADETVYMASTCGSDMVGALMTRVRQDLARGQQLNIKVIHLP